MYIAFSEAESQLKLRIPLLLGQPTTPSRWRQARARNEVRSLRCTRLQHQENLGVVSAHTAF